jgi:glycosyltransferase involved in cell wall biosynthesis
MDVNEKISIVIPCYNEADGIDAAIERILGCIRPLPYIFELIFIDDGSEDRTLERLLRARDKCSEQVEIVVLEFSRNFGKEAALTAGLDVATGDACIFLDADLQDPPELIEQLITEWRAGYEVVAIRRRSRETDPMMKRVTAALFYKFNNLVADRPIPENVGDSRLIDRVVVEALRQLPENRRFMKGLFSWVGFRTAFIDGDRVVRTQGKTKFSALRLINFALEGITSFSTSLLRLWTIVGLLISIYAFGHGAYIIFRVMIRGVELPGYASLAVVVLFLGGIQMVGFGILGEYIGRIYYEAKRRPIYIVRRRYGQGGV